MSRTGTVTLGIVAILMLFGIGAYIMYPHTSSYPSDNSAALGTASSSDYATTLPSGSNTSDTALQADLTSVDAQMAAFTADSQAVSDSVSAQQNGGTPN
jgi:hypothetical protein